MAEWKKIGNVRLSKNGMALNVGVQVSENVWINGSVNLTALEDVLSKRAEYANISRAVESLPARPLEGSP